MKDLNPFDFEPAHQPGETPVSFRLKPLDMRGRVEVESALYTNAMGEPRLGWEGLVAASRYIVGWTGEGLGEFSRARVRAILDGDNDRDWGLWIAAIAGKLLRHAQLQEDAAKKY
jgi:hypothetical protein